MRIPVKLMLGRRIKVEVDLARPGNRSQKYRFHSLCECMNSRTSPYMKNIRGYRDQSTIDLDVYNGHQHTSEN